MAINNIEQVKWIVHKILPAVYDEALSYYEVLCKVIAKLNEVIANEDEQNEMLVDFDERLSDVEEAVSEIESDIRGEITDVLKTYNGYANGKFLGVSGDEIKWVNMPTVITSYDSLSDKPQINGVTLAGNKTSAQLNIKQIPAGGVVGQVLKKLSDNDYDVAWGSSGGGGGGGTTDYTDLDNKPQINGVTLAGNKSTADLSLGDMKKADYDSDSAVDDAGGIAAYVGSAISTGTSGLMSEMDYDAYEVVKDAGGIVPYVENKVVASVVQNFPEESDFDVVMDNADDGVVASTVIKGKTVACNQLANYSGVASDTVQGIVITNNNDGSFTLNGTENTGVNMTYNLNTLANRLTANHVYYIGSNLANANVGVTLANYYEAAKSGLAGCIFVCPSVNNYTNLIPRLYVSASTQVTSAKVIPQVIDLTAEGYTSAETTDVATFKAAFLKKNGYPLPLAIPYDAGSLANVNGKYRVRGRNLWDEEWEIGYIDGNGQLINASTIRSKNYCRCKNNDIYGYIGNSTPSVSLYLAFYDANKDFILRRAFTNQSNDVPSNAYYFKITTSSEYGNTYNNDICINDSDSSINGQYFPNYDGGEIDCSNAPLNGVGTAQDEKDFATGTRTNKMSPITDLSTFNWTYDAVWIADSNAKPCDTLTIANIACDTYVPSYSTQLSQRPGCIAVDNNGKIRCNNNSSTTPPTGNITFELATPVVSTETPQPVYTQDGYNVLEPISGGVQSADVNATYLHLLGGLFARKADLVNGKVPDSQLPDFGEANVINFDSIVSGTTTIPADDRTKLSDMTKPCEIHIGTAVYHRATPFRFYWEQKGTVLNVVKILEINSSTYIITETTMFASYATTSTNKGIPETGTNGVWKLVANKTVASDSANTGFTYTELLGGNYDEYMIVVKGKAKGNVSILNTNSGGTSLSNTITYREGASTSISNNQSAIPATNGNYFEATLTLKNYISFGSGNGGYFALEGNVCDGDSTTQSTYFIQCAWKIAYAGTYNIGFNNLAKDSEIRLYGRNTGDYVFPNPL